MSQVPDGRIILELRSCMKWPQFWSSGDWETEPLRWSDVSS
jgi:hypothetical protein